MSEEKAHMPFRKGDEFEMVIIVNQEGYQVNVNGQNFYFFQHRLPFEEVDTLEIGGDVVIQTINIIGGGWSGGVSDRELTYDLPKYVLSLLFQGGMPGYQGGNLPVSMCYFCFITKDIMYFIHQVVPYSNMIPGGLSPKRTIIIRGMVPPGANRFHINFKVSYSGDIVFHLNPRFTEFIVVRNSFLGGCWGREEKELEFNPFQPGQYFDMSIRSGNQRFKVYVNGQHLCSFNHRFQEFQQVDTLEVEGDVQLSYVQF
ncbi:LEG4 protein, partial [Polypterus senegalus]